MTLSLDSIREIAKPLASERGLDCRVSIPDVRDCVRIDIMDGDGVTCWVEIDSQAIENCNTADLADLVTFDVENVLRMRHGAKN